MLSLFQHKRRSSSSHAEITPATKRLDAPTRPESAAALLATPRRQRLLNHIWQRTSLSRKQFARLYRAPLERYAELVQQFPASESHHHSYHGGMLDHGLEIVAYALKLKQSYLLPVGATPEDQSAQAEAWTAAIAYAALLHDIGKIAVDLHVEYTDGQVWHPWHGPLQRPYRFRYRKGREYRLHGAASGLLYTSVLSREILDWLSSYPELWSALLYLLAGQYEHAGILGELVTKADQASVAQALGGDPGKAMAAPKHALQRKLLEGLRYLLREELKLNQPQASDGWLTEDGVWLVSKTVSDKLRAHLLSQGVDGIPANNTAVFNVLQDHSLLQPTPEGKAIWKATVTSDTGWSHSFTLLRMAPALIWEADERPAVFAGNVIVDSTEQVGESNDTSAKALATVACEVEQAFQRSPADTIKPATGDSHTDSGNDGLSDAVDELLEMLSDMPVTQDSANTDSVVISEGVGGEWKGGNIRTVPAEPAPKAVSEIQPVEPPAPEEFMVWLKKGIHSRRLIINDAKALIHTVAETVYLVSPGIFQRYAQEHPQIAVQARSEGLPEWRWVQRRFEKLQLHRKHASGLNIWTCRVMGPRKTRKLHGYLLSEPSLIFESLPPSNPYISLADETSPLNEC